MDKSLQDIITGCQRQVLASQKELYKMYFNLLMTTCMRYVQRQEDAEEILNNAFLRIFRHINKFAFQGSFDGWMKRIVVNCCLDYIKKNQYLQQSKLVPLDTGATADHLPTGSILEVATAKNLVEEQYDKAYLLRLLQELPETTRLVFNLYVFEEYNHREIGEALDMAERTSQAHLAKARQLLSAQLDKKKLIHELQRV
jgi:RNA polymerase sigma factor (sigma-70 family)